MHAPARNITDWNEHQTFEKKRICSRRLPCASETAENCHASMKIVVMSVSTVGILYEAAKIPFASSPQMFLTKNCPDTLVTHQNIVVGIIGTLYFSISRTIAGSNSEILISR